MATVTQSADSKSSTWPGGEQPSTPCLPGCRAAYDRQRQNGGAKR